jgi:quercetin dioxygenase-like cupin family protein
MRVNSEFSEVFALNTGNIDWLESPKAGVERRMLDRIGDEVARATTIVRYAPGSHFSAHTHSGGEEFIVLDGTFQDEHGDYPAGTYVRNPIGTHHIPRSDDGCTIFVKLWQFVPQDQRQFSVNLNTAEMMPDPQQSEIQRSLLHRYGDEQVMLEDWPASTSRRIDSSAGVEILLLDGTVEFVGRNFGRHDWIRLPAGYSAQMHSGAAGARIWIKSGHLTNVQVPKG